MTEHEAKRSERQERKITLTNEEAGDLEHCLSFLTGFFRLMEPEKHFDAGLTALFSEASEKVAASRAIIFGNLNHAKGNEP